MTFDPRKDLDALQALCNAATPAPWRTVYGEVNDAPPWAVTFANGAVFSPTDDHDADFIAAAREAVPNLIARVRELERQADLLIQEKLAEAAHWLELNQKAEGQRDEFARRCILKWQSLSRDTQNMATAELVIAAVKAELAQEESKP